MNLQIISDSQGNTTGVFIPINEWNSLKTRFQELEDESLNSLPSYHKEVVSERIEQYNADKSNILDFE